MNTITFTNEEHDELRNLVSWAYANNYYHNTSDTDAFNTMSDKVEGIYDLSLEENAEWDNSEIMEEEE